MEDIFMGTIRKTIVVTDQQDVWIKSQILGGAFTNDSEYVRDLIRRDQARNSEIDLIRSELIAGEKSGRPKAFDAIGFEQKMLAKHAKKAG
jgi:antitoxin ParD1/3/4